MRKSFSIFQAGLCAVLFFFIPGIFYSQSFIQKPLRECRFLTTDTLSKNSIASDNISTIYIPLPGGLIKAVNGKNLETIWQSDIGGEIAGSIIFNGSSLFVASISEKSNSAQTGETKKNIEKKLSVQSLSAATGITQWRKEFSVTGADALRVYIFSRQKSKDSGELYVLSEEGMLRILNKETGETESEQNLHKTIKLAVLTTANKIFFGSDDNKIYAAANPETSAEITEIAKLQDQPTALFSDVYGELFAGDRLGFVYNFRANKALTNWKARSGAEITAISDYADKLIVSSSDNFVYFLSKNSGKRIWKKRLEGKIQGGLPTDNGFVIISPLGTNIATALDLKNGKSVNVVTVGEKTENSFISNPLIIGDNVIFSTVNGFYSYNSEGCQKSE